MISKSKIGKTNAFGTRKLPETSFWPLFGPNWAHFRANKIFSAPQKLKHYQVLDTITSNHDMQNRRKVMNLDQENGLKPHFGPFLALTGPILEPKDFFSSSKTIRN